METDRQLLVRWFDEAHKDGLWAAPWNKAVEGLTPQQAAWQPARGRHSIWQIINHMMYWREHWRRSLVGDKPTPAERDRRNFEAPTDVTQAAWDKTLERLARSNKETRDLLADPATPLDGVQYFLPHDAYHIGQIMLLRALQGLPSIE
jgi:uncharacterized damage-inducible protein DinB